MSKPLLSDLHRSVEPIHQTAIGVTKPVQATTRNPQPFEQRVQASLDHGTSVPRLPRARDEQEVMGIGSGAL